MTEHEHTVRVRFIDAMAESHNVRVRFISGETRIVLAKDFHWVGEEGARSATAIIDGREVPIYRRAEPEWGNMWVEQAPLFDETAEPIAPPPPPKEYDGPPIWRD